MSALKYSQSKGRTSSPSPAGLLRRQCYGDAATGHSPWRRGLACHGSGGWVRPSISPFEQSGKTIIMTHQLYREVALARDDHVTDGRDGSNGGNNDDDDFWMCDDDAFYEKDGEVLSQEMVRTSSWVRDFLARVGEMSSEEINDPSHVTLCPACQRGPDRSLQYRGFHGLLDHARTVMVKRVRLHRRFAEILDDELRIRNERKGGSLRQVAAMDEKWEGLGGAESVPGDQMILWPPMVLVLNTRLGKQDDSEKWEGMRNRDLLDSFKEYEPVKAKSAYGSHGHSGVSLLTFDSTVLGYLQAQQLHGQFIQEGRGKYDWHKQKPWRQSTEKRLLYGYMVTKEEELSLFSAYSGARQKLRYEMKPYQVVVGNPLKEMYGRSQKHAILKREIAKEIEHNKGLEKTCEQHALEIQAIRRMLNEQSDEHIKEIKSLNECNERLNCQLKKSELERKKMQEQICSLHLTGDCQDETNSTVLAKHMSYGNGECDKPDNEMDEIAEEQLYLGACDFGDKKKRPLLNGAHMRHVINCEARLV